MIKSESGFRWTNPGNGICTLLLQASDAAAAAAAKSRLCCCCCHFRGVHGPSPDQHLQTQFIFPTQTSAKLKNKKKKPIACNTRSVISLPPAAAASLEDSYSSSSSTLLKKLACTLDTSVGQEELRARMMGCIKEMTACLPGHCVRPRTKDLLGVRTVVVAAAE